MTGLDKNDLRSRIVAVVLKHGKPLTFDQIYAALSSDGLPMPQDKPKLLVRRILYDIKIFDVNSRGAFFPKDHPELNQEQDKPPKKEFSPKPVVSPSRFPRKPPDRTPVKQGAPAPLGMEAAATKAAQSVADHISKEASAAAMREAVLASVREAASEVAKSAEHAAKDVAERLARQTIEEAKQAAAAAATDATAAAVKQALTQAAGLAAAEAARVAAETAREVTGSVVKEAVEKTRAAIEEIVNNALATIRQAALNPSQDPRASGPHTAPQSESENAQQQADTMIGGTSIRERIMRIMLDTGRPMSFQEIYSGLENDGYPLPLRNPEEVVHRVLDNPTLFAKDALGRYVAITGTW